MAWATVTKSSCSYRITIPCCGLLTSNKYRKGSSARIRVPMRRGASIALLAVLLAGVLAPLAQATASSLPACCRVNGPHHCAGMAGLDGFHTQAQSCPFRSYPAIVGAMVAVLGPRLSQTLLSVRADAVVAALIGPTRPSFDTVQKRGPPQA